MNRVPLLSTWRSILPEGVWLVTAWLALASRCVFADVVLVPANAVWKYLDTGTNLGTAWQAPEYNDNLWPSGAAKLGYGDGDEQTVVGYGTNANDKFITTYFRRTFVVNDRAALTNFALRLLRDDGAVVYLNGVEILRNNLPEGLVHHRTLAVNGVTGTEEDQFFPAPVSPTRVLAGTNVLAVELHQSDPDSSDLGFALELLGNTALGNMPPAIAWSRPTPFSSFVTNQPISVAVTAADEDGQVAQLAIYEDGSLIWSGATNQASLVRSNATPGIHSYVARAVDERGLASTSSPPVGVFVGAAHADTTFFPDFRTTNGLVLKGHAYQWPNYVRVCPNTNGPGGFWLAQRQMIRAGFESTFTCRILHEVNGGADGFAFVIHAAPAPQLGWGAGHIGYGGLTNSLAVELDTWYAPEFADASSRHLSVHSRGTGENTGHHSASLGSTNWIPDITDGGVHQVRIRYFPGVLKAFVDDLVTPMLTVNVDLNDYLALGDGRVWIGITSSIGFGKASHDVLSWSFTSFSNELPQVAMTWPTNEGRLPPGSNVLFQAAASDSDGTIVKVEYFDGANSLGVATNSPFSLLWSNVPAGFHLLHARATDDRFGATHSAPVRFFAFPQEVLVPFGSAWRYLDNNIHPGAAWTSTSFGDQSWSNGPAQLGFGDGDEATLINGGPGSSRHVTAWFRRAFSLASAAAFTNLGLRLLRDDGAVVYLNGVEVFRSNMPEGAISQQTLALVTIQDETETNIVSARIPPLLLSNGLNVVAVEVHQSSITSSDASFDLELVANSITGDYPPWVALTQPVLGDRFTTGQPVLLRAATSDPDSAVRQVVFRANDDVLGSAEATPYELIWTNATPGLHALTARAIDDWGLVTTSAPVYVAVASPGADVVFLGDFGGTSSLTLMQDAAIVTNRLRLTPSATGRTGAAYLGAKRLVQHGFESVCQFQITDLQGQGGEGMTLLIQNNPVPLPGIGSSSLGYGGISNSLAIEVDTRSSTGNPYNELSIQTRGPLPNDPGNTYALARTASAPEMSGLPPHLLRVRYRPGVLEVFLDNFATPLLSAAVRLEELFPLDNGRAWIGLTASTATDTEIHDVPWWYFHANQPPALALLQPAPGAILDSAQPLQLIPSASDNDGILTQVRFFTNGVHLATVFAPPFAYAGAPLAPGDYQIGAEAMDDYGATTTVAPRSVRAVVAPQLARVERQPDGSALLEFSTVSGRRYQVRYSHDLRNWFDVSPSFVGTGAIVVWRDEGPPATPRLPRDEPSRFYRVAIVE